MTDPHRDGHERFRVTKENFGVSSDTRKIVLQRLNELQDWDTTLWDGLDELEYREDDDETKVSNINQRFNENEEG